MENEKKIKVVLLEPGKLARATEIDASLAGILGKEFGADVSGYAFEVPADFLRADDPQTIRAELTDIRDTAYDISTRMMRSLEQSKAPRLSEQER